MDEKYVSLTVFAHFCRGSIDVKEFPGPAGLDIAGEGSFYPYPHYENGGGVIVAAFSTDDVDRLVSAYREYLKDKELTMLAVHKKGEEGFCYAWTADNIF